MVRWMGGKAPSLVVLCDSSFSHIQYWGAVPGREYFAREQNSERTSCCFIHCAFVRTLVTSAGVSELHLNAELMQRKIVSSRVIIEKVNFPTAELPQCLTGWAGGSGWESREISAKSFKHAYSQPLTKRWQLPSMSLETNHPEGRCSTIYSYKGIFYCVSNDRTPLWVTKSNVWARRSI